MDITRGEFDDFSSRSSSRTQRNDTRSSSRTETNHSLEILPPEEARENLFMSEELSDDENIPDENNKILKFTGRSSNFDIKSVTGTDTDSEYACTARSDKNTHSEKSRPSTTSSFAESVIEDEKLRELMEKMKKYDRILLKKMKREKEVKRQRLLFERQMLDELNSSSDKSEVTANMNKYLALMPPPGKLQEMLDHLDIDEFVPIFPTQINEEENNNPLLTRPHSASRLDVEDDAKSEDSASDNLRSKSAKTDKKGKTDFIKRNIELAKDAGNYISMTDDEKKRLNELLSDIDSLENDQSDLTDSAFTNQALMAGEGYLPDEFEMRRLTEIDEKIQSLLPPDEFDMICGTPNLTSTKSSIEMTEIGRRIYSENQEHANERIHLIQQRLENIDEEWKQLYEGTTPRLTNEQLQKLLDECSNTSSRMSSSLSQSLNSWRPSSQSSISTNNTEQLSEYDTSDVGSLYSIPKPLSRATLDQLLLEAKSSLGLADGDQSFSDDESNASPRSIKTPLFETVNRSQLSERRQEPEVFVEELDQSFDGDFV